MVLGRRALGVLASAALVAWTVASTPAAGRATPHTLRDDAITIGSFDFVESTLLAEIYGQALERGGYHVRRATELGPRELVAPALARGLIELVPEYAGTALHFISLGAVTPGAEISETHDALRSALAPQHVAVLEPAPAQDANTFVVRRATARQYSLRTLSDLAQVSEKLTFGGSPECSERPLCLPGLRRVYGIRFREVVKLDAGGPATRQALRTRAVDVALLFTTDPALATGAMVELLDDRALQPSENVVPLVRTEVVERWGAALTDRIDAVSERLTTDKLRALNAQAARGERIASVARRWLEAEGLR